MEGRFLAKDQASQATGSWARLLFLLQKTGVQCHVGYVRVEEILHPGKVSTTRGLKMFTCLGAIDTPVSGDDAPLTVHMPRMLLILAHGKSLGD